MLMNRPTMSGSSLFLLDGASDDERATAESRECYRANTHSKKNNTAFDIRANREGM
jgi:hypothetical protein